jgi:hypothetical protein
LGIDEIEGRIDAPGKGRIRRKGGGRKRTVDIDRTLREDLLSLLEPTERGDPQSPLRWTTKSMRHLSSALKAMGHKTSHRMVNEILRAERFSLQANRKTKEGTSNPDRDEQFRPIAESTLAFMEKGQPVISVDTKKKELVGNSKNGGREWCEQGCPHDVWVTTLQAIGAEQRLTASTIGRITRDGSASASPPTRRPSPSRVFAGGG